MWAGFSDPNSGHWQWSDRGRRSASLHSPREREPIPMQFHGASELTAATASAEHQRQRQRAGLAEERVRNEGCSSSAADSGEEE